MRLEDRIATNCMVNDKARITSLGVKEVETSKSGAFNSTIGSLVSGSSGGAVASMRSAVGNYITRISNAFQIRESNGQSFYSRIFSNVPDVPTDLIEED